MKDSHVGMLMGGHNAEHEVSMKTGAALARALRARGYRVSDIEVDKDLPGVIGHSGIEVAFVALHGRWGEDGCVQGLLECMRIPYTGCGVLASALSMDKIVAKALFRHRGLPLAEDLVVTRQRAGAITAGWFLREFVGETPWAHLDIAGMAWQERDKASRFAGDILIERYVPGREISVGVLDDQSLGAIEIVPAETFYDYKAKYQSAGATRYLFPAPLSGDQNREALALGLEAYRTLGCSGVSRVDFILTEEGGFHLLEVNTIPGMTENSLIPKIASGVGMSFEDLAERLLLGAALKG